MDTTEKLKVEIREAMSGRVNNRLRQSGYLTGNINSAKIGSIPVTIPMKDFQKALARGGRSTIFDLELDNGKHYNAMVKDIQIAAIGGKYLDIIFQEMSLTEKTHAEVSIIVEGKESLWAKKLGIAQQLDKITVSALPHDIPNAININVANLEAGDSLAIKDLSLPKDVTTDVDPEHVVLTVIENITKVEEPETTDEEIAEEEVTNEAAKDSEE